MNLLLVDACCSRWPPFKEHGFHHSEYSLTLWINSYHSFNSGWANLCFIIINVFNLFQLTAPLVLSTSLCHVVVTWECRKRVPSINSLENIITRNLRASRSQIQKVGPAVPTEQNPSSFPAGMELSSHGLPDHVVVWDNNLYSLALRRAIELSRRLWTASDGGVSTRLVFSKTSVSCHFIFH